MASYIRNPETITGQIDEELVMVDIEKGSYYSLSAVATRIWELLETPLTSESLCAQLVEEYEVNLDQCRAEVEEHLAKMIDLGLVKTIA